ncbi:MAG: DUF2029 domain-containing protein [Thermoleophilia bacterium]|nr:DUF2029 domain-containing protein [Thermoleophilia bacterium]
MARSADGRPSRADGSRRRADGGASRTDGWPPRADAASPWTRTALALGLAVVLQVVVLTLLFPNLWYGLHDISDIPIYQEYSSLMAQGYRPYLDFGVEYPPLALPVFRLGGDGLDPDAYTTGFTVAMGVITIAGAIVVTLAALALWPLGRRPYWAAAAYAAAVAFTGAIIVNRYDAAVALLIAGLLLCLARRWLTAAAFILGLGFALKLTPLALLPLVLLLAGHPRRWTWPLLAFTAAAVTPFIPYVVSSPGGVWEVFAYHLERPLQIESVLGTPMLVAGALGWAPLEIGFSHGSHQLIASGAGFAAYLSGPLTVVAVLGVYWMLWRRQDALREAPEEQPLAVLALLLAMMAFGKVLSPQYVIWMLPPLALVAVRDRAVAVLGAVVLLLTQLEFPGLYGDLLREETEALVVVAVRNVALLVLFGVVGLRVWWLGERPPNARAAAGSRLAAPRRGL